MFSNHFQLFHIPKLLKMSSECVERVPFPVKARKLETAAWSCFKRLLKNKLVNLLIVWIVDDYQKYGRNIVVPNQVHFLAKNIVEKTFEILISDRGTAL